MQIVSFLSAVGWLVWERFACNIDCENDPKNCIRLVKLFMSNDRMGVCGGCGGEEQWVKGVHQSIDTRTLTVSSCIYDQSIVHNKSTTFHKNLPPPLQ